MKLFAGLRKIREYQREQLPFLKSVVEFDIVVEIGFAEEAGTPITLKQLSLLGICSRTTLRRKLAQLMQQEIIVRQKSQDRRLNLLIISPGTFRLLTRYGQTLKAIAGTHFKRVIRSPIG